MAPAEQRAEAYLDLLARLPPLACRDDLARLAQANFSRTGRAAEIGVYEGKFGRHNLQHWRGEYHAIDSWAKRNDTHLREGGREDKNGGADLERAYSFARTNLDAVSSSPRSLGGIV